MALNKKVYVDNQTVIPAANLNAIQDEVISNAGTLSNKSDVGHKHKLSDITDYTAPEEYTLPTASSTVLGGVKVGAGLAINNGVLSATGGGTADSVDWSNIQNKPSTYPPAEHTHSQYLTEHQSLKTINNQSIVGTGNLTISGEPAAYLKTAAVSGNKLTLTNKDGTTVEYTPSTGGTADSVDWSNVLNKPSTFAPSEHNHDSRYYTETEMDNKLALKAEKTHTHDDRYYTETEMDTKLAAKAASDHTHGVATTSTAGFMSATDKAKLDDIPSGGTTITIDSALSSTSTNPVQNKIITSALNGKAPAYQYSTTDLTAGTSALATGVMYLVYE